MNSFEVITDSFPGVDQQVTEVRKWRGLYDSLVAKLGELGTEVKRVRVLERDQDVAPNNFVRGAVHEFVFPPQPEGRVGDMSHFIDTSPGYTLRQEDIHREYTDSLVRGRVEVRYDDAKSRVTFSVFDLMEQSELPDEAVAAIAQLEV